MSQLIPYLRFNHSKCREAMNWYQSIIGGKLSFQTLGETPMAKDMPAETHSRIMHATLKSGGVELAGSDMMRDKAVVGDNIVLALGPDTEEKARDIFSKLSEGGEVFMPLEDAFWGALFGVVTDKYGIEWMINHQRVK